MSIITRYLAKVTEPEFKLARDLTAMAMADGNITPEEQRALNPICHMESIDEIQLYESLQNGFDGAETKIPQSRKEKEAYLRELILLIGADGYAAPQEIFLFQIVASRMGLNQMDVVSQFMLTATRRYFNGDIGSRVLASFLKNYINPKGKNEKENRQCLRTIYETIATNTEELRDRDIDLELLRQNLEHATETLLENKILMKEFRDMALDFARMLKEEEQRVLRKFI